MASSENKGTTQQPPLEVSNNRPIDTNGRELERTLEQLKINTEKYNQQTLIEFDKSFNQAIPTILRSNEDYNRGERAGLQKGYFPYNSGAVPIANAITAGATVAGAAAGVYGGLRTGHSFPASILTGAVAGGTIGTAAYTVSNDLLHTSNALGAEEAAAELSTSGKLNAYITRSNYGGSRRAIYNKDYFRSSFEDPLEVIAPSLGVSAKQLAPAVGDLMSMGIVSAGAKKGEDLNYALTQAAGIFKSIEAFFGSVDVRGLASKIKAMRQAGFTEETMKGLADSMQHTIFSMMPDSKAKQELMANAIGYGSALTKQGLAPNMMVSTYLNSAQNARLHFNELSEYTKFQFGTSDNLAKTYSNAMLQYMSKNAPLINEGSGDFFGGVNSVLNKFDLTTARGREAYQQYKYEASKTYTQFDTESNLIKQANTLADTLGITLKEALTSLLGSPKKAEAVLINRSQSLQNIKDNIEGLSDYDFSTTHKITDQTIANFSKHLFGNRLTSDTDAAIYSMSKARYIGNDTSDAYKEHTYFNRLVDLSSLYSPGGLTTNIKSVAGDLVDPKGVMRAVNSYSKEAGAQLMAMQRGYTGASNFGEDKTITQAVFELQSNSDVQYALNTAKESGVPMTISAFAKIAKDAGAAALSEVVSKGARGVGELIKYLSEAGAPSLANLVKVAIIGVDYNLGDTTAPYSNMTNVFGKTTAEASTSSNAMKAVGLGALSLGAGLSTIGTLTSITGTALSAVGLSSAGAALAGTEAVAGVVGMGAAGVIGAVSTVTLGVGAVALGAYYGNKFLNDTSLGAEGAAALDKEAWGVSLAVDAVAALFIDPLSDGFLSRTANLFNGDIKTSIAANLGYAIYSKGYTELHLQRNKNYKEQQYLSDVIKLVTSANQSGANADYQQAILESWGLTGGGTGNTLFRNAISIVYSYIANHKIPVQPDSFRNSLVQKLSSSVMTGRANDDYDKMYKVKQTLSTNASINTLKSRAGTDHATYAHQKAIAGNISESLQNLNFNINEVNAIERDIQKAHTEVGTNATLEQLKAKFLEITQNDAQLSKYDSDKLSRAFKKVTSELAEEHTKETNIDSKVEEYAAIARRVLTNTDVKLAIQGLID